VNRQKYIHTKRKFSRENYKGNYGRKPKHKPMCIEDYEKLPKHEPIKTKNWFWHEYYYSTTFIDFYTNIRKILKERIGDSFDDIYSELISKTKPKFRYILDEDINWILTKVCYYEHEIPYYSTCRYDKMIVNNFYLDKDQKVRYFGSKGELEIYARNKYREKKLERILNDLFESEEIMDCLENLD